MNKDQFRQSLRRHKLTMHDFAIMIGVDYSTVKRFGSNNKKVPEYIRIIMKFADERGHFKGVL